MDETKTVALPSGGTATLRTAESLRARDQDAIELVVAQSGALEADYGESVGSVVARLALAKRLVVAWHLPYQPGAKVPTEDPSAWAELTIPDRNKLVSEADECLKILFPKPATPDDAGVPDSPTKPADAS